MLTPSYSPPPAVPTIWNLRVIMYRYSFNDKRIHLKYGTSESEKTLKALCLD